MFGWLRAHRRAAYWERCWREEHEEKLGLQEELRQERKKLRLLLAEMARLKGVKP